MVSNNTNCEACNKKGFPILLSRFGFSSNPKGNTPIAPPVNYPKMTGQGSYVLRKLREGYVYIYDEMDKSLSCFMVSSEGIYKKIKLSLPATQSAGQPMHEPCMKMPDRLGNGLLITVPKAEVSRTVWIGFSSHLWTNRICQLHITNETYRSHMTAVMVGSGGKNSCPIQQVNGVADFSMASLQNVFSSVYSPQRKGYYQKKIPNSSPIITTAKKVMNKQKIVIDAANKLVPNKGVVVALTDSVALMAEIAQSISYQLGQYNHDIGHSKKALTNLNLTAIEMSICDSTEYKYINDEIENEAFAKVLLGGSKIKKLASVPVDVAAQDRIEDSKLIIAERAAAKEWAKYNEKLQPNARKDWQQQFQTEMKKFDQNIAFPLAQLHVSWQKSIPAVAYFDKTFDSTELNSGASYMREVVTATDSIFATKPAIDYVMEQLQSNAFKSEYFVLNALVINNKDLKQKATEAMKAVKPAIDNPIRDVPWDGLIGAQVEAAKRVFSGEADVLGNLLITNISGVVLKFTQTILTGKVGVGIVAVAMAAKERFITIDFVAKENKLLEMVVRSLIEAGKEHAPPAIRLQLNNPDVVEKKVKKLLKRIRKSKGISITQHIRIRMVVVRSLLVNANNLDELVRAVGLKGDMRLQMSTHWRQVIRNGLTAARTSAGSATRAHLSFGAAVLTGVFQAWVLCKLWKDANKPDDAMQHTKNENWVRFGVGFGALVGTLGAMIDEGVTKFVAPQNVGKYLGYLKSLGAQLGKLGPGAAIAAGVMDGFKGFTEHQEGNKGVAILYGASGVAGITAGVMMFFAASSPAMSIPFFGWILAACAAIAIAASVAISYFKDNSLQDWVERCSFGKLVDQRYATLAIEQRELKLAYKDMGAS